MKLSNKGKVIKIKSNKGNEALYITLASATTKDRALVT